MARFLFWGINLFPVSFGCWLIFMEVDAFISRDLIVRSQSLKEYQDRDKSNFNLQLNYQGICH